MSEKCIQYKARHFIILLTYQHRLRMLWTMYPNTVNYTFYSIINLFQYDVHCTLYTVHCTPYSIRRTVQYCTAYSGHMLRMHSTITLVLVAIACSLLHHQCSHVDWMQFHAKLWHYCFFWFAVVVAVVEVAVVAVAIVEKESLWSMEVKEEDKE